MFTFVPFQEPHLPLLRAWLAKPHIAPFWQEPESDRELKDKFFTALPARGVRPFLIEREGRPIGYIQYYDAHRIGGGWWADETPGTFGVDIMIGDENCLGQGDGPQILRAFTAFIRQCEPAAQSLIIDPEPANERAIRAFEKAGFIRGPEIMTPNGAALLMRLALA